jgi:hypothetical protein
MTFGAVARSEDWERIRELPRREYDRAQAERDVRDFTPLLTTAKGKAAGVSLRPAQAYVLREFYENRGAFAALTVGGGKTLLSFLAAYVLDAKRPVLVIPEALREKTYKEFSELSEHWITPSPPPTFAFYKQLTRVENLDLLDRMQADLYILDEAHKLSNQDGSATKRLARDIDARDVPCLAMTGTSGRLSITDFSHFLAWTLKEQAPVPLDHDELELWANALDEREPKMYRRLEPGALLELLPANDCLRIQRDLEADGRLSRLGLARAVFRARMAWTPGCIVNDDEDCEQPLTIAQHAAPEDPIINAHFVDFRVEKVTPDGWDITDPLSEWLFEHQLGCGFNYVFDPRPPEWWLEARKVFARFVRLMIERSAETRRPLDTELAVRKAFPNHPAIANWRETKPKFKPNSVAVWHSGSVIDWAAAWAERNTGLIWVPHLAVGSALSEVTGLPFYAAEGCTTAGASIERDPGKKPAIVSILSNIEGRNLQRWNRNLIVGCPQSALTLQQLLGRTHRYGQTKPVHADVLLTSGGSAYSFDMARREAKFVLQTQGLRQKLLRAHIERATFKSKALRWVRKSVEDEAA